MTSSRRARALRAAASGLLAAAVVVGGATGCGQTTPADTAPGITQQLARVDAAIAAGNSAQARSALEGLIDETNDAQAAGDLSSDQAQPIIAAAQDLLALLPAGPTPTPSETPSQDSEPADEGGGPPPEEERGGGKAKDEKGDDDKPGKNPDKNPGKHD
jgi:hypothetical protein